MVNTRVVIFEVLEDTVSIANEVSGPLILNGDDARSVRVNGGPYDPFPIVSLVDSESPHADGALPCSLCCSAQVSSRAFAAA